MIHRTKLPRATERTKLRFQIRPVLQGPVGPGAGRVHPFELGNVAATLLILRATDALTAGHGSHTATQIAIALDVVYSVAATITFPG